MPKSILLGDTARQNLIAIQRAQAKIADISERLATGKRVNSIIDDAANFTAASELMSRTKNMNKLLDGIGQNVRAIDVAASGAQTITDLLYQAETVATQTLDYLEKGETDPKVVQLGIQAASDDLPDVIQSSAPVGYWRLNGNATNTGSGAGIDGTPQNGVSFAGAPLYDKGGSSSAIFNGVQGILIPDSNDINLQAHAQRSVELVFNADNTAGRQVLYEEGAGVNSFAIYIDNGRLYASGRDQGAWGPPNISTAISAGQTYHVAFVFDHVTNDNFTVYVDGVSIGSVPVNADFPPHSGDIGIGYSPDGAWYHDGTSGAPNYFDGRISDVALYNTALTAAQIQTRVDSFTSNEVVRYINPDYQALIDQIDQIAEDAHYRGLHLLKGEDMTTWFNESYTHNLVTEGDDFTVQGLGLLSYNFNDIDTVREIVKRVQNAIERVKRFGTSIQHDLNILKTRNVSIGEASVIHESGAGDLMQADLNEEGANLLAANTRLSLSQTALSLATDFNQSILQVIGS